MPIPKPTRPAKRLLLRDMVFVRLRDAIVDGDLHPGETVVESDVEAWANASRTPVRETIDRLAAVGLIDVLPQRGTLVAEIDVDRAAQTFSLLGEVLAVSFGVVAPVLTAGQRTALAAAARAVRSPVDLFRSDGFFDTVVAVVGNPRIRQVFDELAPHVIRTWRLVPETAPPIDGLDLSAVLAATPEPPSGPGVVGAGEQLLRAWFTSVDTTSVTERGGN
jgi:DNA-binding GntR family transcriptional regulator